MYNGELELVSLIKDGRHDAFKLLLISYDDFIKKIVNATETHDNEKDDLYQEGLIGLYKAAISYKEGSNASFSTYANTCIRHSIISALRKHSGIKNKNFCSSLFSPLDFYDVELSLEANPDQMLIQNEEYNEMMRWNLLYKKSLPCKVL